MEEAWLANDLVTSTWIATNEGNYDLLNSEEQALAKRDQLKFIVTARQL